MRGYAKLTDSVCFREHFEKRERKRQESYGEAQLGNLNIRPKSLDFAP